MQHKSLKIKFTQKTRHDSAQPQSDRWMFLHRAFRNISCRRRISVIGNIHLENNCRKLDCNKFLIIIQTTFRLKCTSEPLLVINMKTFQGTHPSRNEYLNVLRSKFSIRKTLQSYKAFSVPLARKEVGSYSARMHSVLSRYLSFSSEYIVDEWIVR